MDKTKCDCRGMVCHTGPGEKMTFVHAHSRVGGKGTYVYLSEECMRRRSGFTVVKQ